MQEWQGEKKGLYHKRESFGRSVSSQEPHAWESLDQSQLQLLLGQPWVFGQESHSVVNWPWRASPHCRAHMWILTSSGHRGDPSLPGLLEANCVQPGAQGCGSKSWDADSSVSRPKGTGRHVWITYSASSLTGHSLKAGLSSEVMKGDLGFLTYFLLAQK